MQASEPFLLGSCTIVPSDHRIHSATKEARLQPRLMRVLVTLADHAPHAVPRQTLLTCGWEDAAYVADEALTKAISELRKRFKQCGVSEEIIRTIPKVGYRLVLLPKPTVPPKSRDMILAPSHPASVAIRLPDHAPQPTHRRLRHLLPTALAALLLLAGAFIVGHRMATTETPQVRMMRQVIPLDSIPTLAPMLPGISIDTVLIGDDAQRWMKTRNVQALASSED